MKTEAALGEHARARDQCDLLPPPLRWIPQKVYEKFKNRKKAFAGQTEEDYMKIYLRPTISRMPQYSESLQVLLLPKLLFKPSVLFR